MLKRKHQNINGCMVTVTDTATHIYDLINTAASTTLKRAGFDTDINAMDIVPIHGDINFMEDGNIPTASAGQPLDKGFMYLGRNISVCNMYLISRNGNDVVCYVQPGVSRGDEQTTITPAGLAPVTEATYAEVDITDADTEYTYTLTKNARSIEMRLDINSEADFKLNIGGEVGDSATDYIPIEDGEMYWRQDINLPKGTVIRFQSPTASQTMKIVTYS